MYSFRKSKKGFTLIELMVVVAIIAILALLGLRLYSTQQLKAKIAMAKANAGTVQVAIQTELIDNGSFNPADTAALKAALTDLSVLQNPFSSLTTDSVILTAVGATAGTVIVLKPTAAPLFTITPCDESAAPIATYILTAQK